MKKRMFSLALAMSLVMGLMAVPASAALSQSDEMAQVTLAVKGRLGIGDEYDKFSGNCTDFGVFRYWQLSWSNEDGGSLDVTADNNGKILSYDCYTPQEDASAILWESGGFNPTFPPVNAAQVEQAAAAFLDKVLSAPESARLDPVQLRLTGYRRSVSVSGSILLNGTDSPLSFSMRLSLPDLAVTSYSRRDSWGMVVTGDVPAAEPGVAQSAARDQLDSALSMELRYVDGGDDAIALRYVPTTQGDWFVDAQTGELIDLSQLPGNRPIYGGGPSGDAAMNGEAAPSEPPMPSLSPVEQATVDQLAGALNAAKLDELLKKIALLGLDKMTQAGASYYMDQETGEITCRLIYTRPLEKDEIGYYSPDDEDSRTPSLRKYITVDAVTGALKRVSTSSEYAKEDAFDGDAVAVAKSFLSAQYPAYFAACTRKNENTDEGYYVRQVNSIPYYSHYLRAEVCRVDGTIGCFSMDWDEDAQFPAPEGIVDEKAAMAAYTGCFQTQLYYTAYPEKADASDPLWHTYIQRVGDVKYRWVLSYVMDGTAPQGVDAFTGEVLAWPDQSSRALSYTDCAGCYGKAEIEALAEYGVGFGRGDQFRPTAHVTQRDMLVLLLSAVGCTYDADDMDEETEDSLYETAYRQGLLTKSQRDPSQAVTRLEFLKAMLSTSPYGRAAQLSGVFKTSFADESAIPAADLGYAAIGQGLGIVAGNDRHELRPNAGLTRQDAAIMLCRFMAS